MSYRLKRQKKLNVYNGLQRIRNTMYMKNSCVKQFKKRYCLIVYQLVSLLELVSLLDPLNRQNQLTPNLWSTKLHNYTVSPR